MNDSNQYSGNKKKSGLKYIIIWIVALGLIFALVFLAGRHAAADMPLGLVEIQQPPHLPVQRRADARQPLGQILVDRGLADAVMRGGGADGAPVLDDVYG